MRPMRRILGYALEGNNDRVREGEGRVDTDNHMVNKRMAKAFGHFNLPRAHQPKSGVSVFLICTQTEPTAGPGIFQALLNFANVRG